MLIISIFILIIAADQICKKLVNERLEEGCYLPVIKGKFYIGNVKNKGAAMGFLSDKPKLLAVFSVFAMVASFFLFFKSLKKENVKISKIGAALILAGGLSNMYDRFAKKEVTDFLYVKYKKLPVFNIADCAILLGAIINISKEFRRK